MESRTTADVKAAITASPTTSTVSPEDCGAAAPTDGVFSISASLPQGRAILSMGPHSEREDALGYPTTHCLFTPFQCRAVALEGGDSRFGSLSHLTDRQIVPLAQLRGVGDTPHSQRCAAD